MAVDPSPQLAGCVVVEDSLTSFAHHGSQRTPLPVQVPQAVVPCASALLS
jgi:hypothetical protein